MQDVRLQNQAIRFFKASCKRLKLLVPFAGAGGQPSDPRLQTAEEIRTPSLSHVGVARQRTTAKRRARSATGA